MFVLRSSRAKRHIAPVDSGQAVRQLGTSLHGGAEAPTRTALGQSIDVLRLEKELQERKNITN